MKLAIIFLSCFVAVSLQQNIYWRSPAVHYPYYYGGYDYPIQPNVPSYLRSGFPFNHNNVKEQAAASDLGLFEPEDYSSPRTFGLKLLALKKLIKLIKKPVVAVVGNGTGLNPLRPNRLVTVINNVVSTVGRIATCFTRTMFAATTACRRRRDVEQFMSAIESHDEAPHQDETVNSAMDELPREGRDADLSHYIQSSQDAVSADSPDVVNFARTGRQYDELFADYGEDYYYADAQAAGQTTTIFSTSIFTSTSTITDSTLAASAALACLPAGFTLC